MSSDEAEIRALVGAWIAASNSGDVPALLALMTDDVLFMTPGRPPFGKERFASDSERVTGVSVDARAEIKEIEIFGPRAFIRNHIQAVVTAPDSPPKRLSGYAMSIFRKEADGRWRLARDANLVMPE
jgi:uncharacterized protein (TIGR02246 family)